ncbi:hypothetical protein [Marinobacter mobilis]|uniref:Uncharacterized protein n=1 Tax=Marinobacter mobilis TaxID=488533 RepID=A0A1H2QS25_9GAMM|nr:hypothetical protein [Marinobacter mobilis]SDW10003.1 hypothetical protein SAMN04487960_101315 [Marinobacter mobilis]
MPASPSILAERGLLRVVARKRENGNLSPIDCDVSYDVEIDGQEVLKSFVSFGEAIQFMDMVAPTERS